jgi:hypothetical protein
LNLIKKKSDDDEEIDEPPVVLKQPKKIANDSLCLDLNENDGNTKGLSLTQKR